MCRTPEIAAEITLQPVRRFPLAATVQLLDDGLGGPHIFNLGHGVLPATSPDTVARLVDTVHQFGRSAGAAIGSIVGRGVMP
jgi:uroporphyrinogen-III decarboxylase